MGCGLLYKPKQRNPLCINGFRVNDCGPDGAWHVILPTILCGFQAVPVSNLMSNSGV